MQLKGSCHCQAVRFTVESAQPYPYQRCYCSICRKTQGGGGYAINLGADNRTLRVEGSDALSVYHARIRDDDGKVARSSGQRHFCKHCASALWLYSPEWPDLVHPFASAIDTALPVPPIHTHLLLNSKAPWVEVTVREGDQTCDAYPKESLADWHERQGLDKS